MSCGSLCYHGQEWYTCNVCASLRGRELASRRTRKPYEAPRVLASVPARVGVAALLGAATAPYARPPGVPAASVPAAELARWRELAAEAGDPLCALARSILARGAS